MTEASTIPAQNHKRFSRAERQSIIEQWKSSGLSKAAFCRREKLNVSLFYGWTCPSSTTSAPAKPSLIPVKIMQTQAAFNTGGLPIILQLNNGITLKIPMPTNTLSLVELIKGLSCS